MAREQQIGLTQHDTVPMEEGPATSIGLHAGGGGGGGGGAPSATDDECAEEVDAPDCSSL